MRFKRGIQAFVLSFMIIGLVACGNSNEGNSNDAKANNNDNVSDEPVTLDFAALKSAYGDSAWEKIIEKFEASHENITVDMTIEKNIEEVMRPNMQAGDYPDVFMLATNREEALTETMIKENSLEEITDVLDMEVPGEDVKVEDKILPGFTDTLATNPYNDDKTYMAPMFYSPTGLFFNQALLDEHDWEVPETWDEMWELGDKAEKEGIALFTYPVSGYFDTLIGALLYAAGGPDFYNDAMTYEEGIWKTDEATKVFETIEKLKDYTHENTVANANPNDFTKNQQLVLDNEALFMPNGNWVVGEMADAPRADDFEWGMMPVPAFEDDGDRYAFTFFEQIWIPSEAENKAAAKEFIAYLYSDEAAEIFYTEGDSPAVQPIEGVIDILSEEDQIFYSIYEDEGALPAMGTFASTDPVQGVNMSETLYESIDSLMAGKLTVDEWQEKVEEASDKLRGALK